MDPFPENVTLILNWTLDPYSEPMLLITSPTLDLKHCLCIILVSLCWSFHMSYLKPVPFYSPMPWIMLAHGIFLVNMYSLKKNSLWENVTKGQEKLFNKLYSWFPK